MLTSLKSSWMSAPAAVLGSCVKAVPILVMLVLGMAMPSVASAQSQSSMRIADSDSGTARRLELGLGKSVIIDLPRDAKEVFVADPKIANAVVRSARKVFVIASTVGQTSLFFMDADGRQIGAVDVNVQRDVAPIKAAIERAISGAQVQVQQLNDGVLLTGSIGSADEAAQAVAIAGTYIGKADGVSNSLTIRGRDQVMLKVTVAEVNRQVLKQLGVNLTGTFSVGNFNVANVGDNPFPLNTTKLSGGGTVFSQSGSAANSAATLRAFERTGVMRTLAEPTLTAISGEAAKFVAGGEIPIPTSSSCSTNDTTKARECTIGVEYKPFGVTLSFTPVVLNEGRISVKVATEVTDLDYKNNLTLEAATIPSINVRRADTTVEIPSGASLVMAGMIQESTKQVINGTPGLMNIPVLGSLFRSRDYLRNETELMIVVTPYIAKTINRNEITLPTDGFADASDPSTWLIGRINRLYGSKGASKPNPNLNGRYGFIID